MNLQIKKSTGDPPCLGSLEQMRCGANSLNCSRFEYIIRMMTQVISRAEFMHCTIFKVQLASGMANGAQTATFTGESGQVC